MVRIRNYIAHLGALGELLIFSFIKIVIPGALLWDQESTGQSGLNVTGNLKAIRNTGQAEPAFILKIQISWLLVKLLDQNTHNLVLCLKIHAYNWNAVG